MSESESANSPEQSVTAKQDKPELVKCEFCDTTLEMMVDGRILVFKAHSDAYCKNAAKTLLTIHKKVIADQARTIGQLQHELSVAHQAFDDFRKAHTY